ncbi:MAG: dihydrodipicolinate reductase C-terminal domain-containing protein [Planctomycetota bacterium]
MHDVAGAPPLRLGIFGRGRLGRAIADAAGRQVVWQVGRDEAPRGGVDVVVDASKGPAVPGHLDWALHTGCDLVIGATGFDLPDLHRRVGQTIGVLVAPNFSLTVALVARLTRVLGAYAAREPRFDPFVLEHHRADKHDAPSGTARLLAETLLGACPRKRRWRLTDGSGPLLADELSVGALRAGSTYSSHVIGLDAPEETLELRHEARSPAAFAAGCLRACAWLRGRKGVFGMDDVARAMLDPLFSNPDQDART